MDSVCCDVTSEFPLALPLGAMDSCVLFSLVFGGHLDFSEQRVLLAVRTCRVKPLHEMDLTPVLLSQLLGGHLAFCEQRVPLAGVYAGWNRCTRQLGGQSLRFLMFKSAWMLEPSWWTQHPDG